MPEMDEEKWKVFAIAYAKYKGNVTRAAEEAGLSPEAFHMFRKRHPEQVRKLLSEGKDEVFQEALDVQDGTLVEAVKSGVPLDSKQLATAKLLYERTKTVETKIELHTTINPYLSIGDAEIVYEVADWQAGKIANARKN